MKTTIDYWGWRTQGELPQIEWVLKAAFGQAGGPVSVAPRRVGLLGFDSSATILVGRTEVGKVGWGGAFQRGWSFVGITGQGCELIDDWRRAQSAAFDCPGYEVRRVDIALDTFEPEIGFAATLAAYRNKEFTLGSSPPKCDPTLPERPEDSAILKIGSRASGKYFRGYERGKHILGPKAVARHHRDSASGNPARCNVGTSTAGRRRSMSVPEMLAWWRSEVEFKVVKAALPTDIIDRRDAHFAGAYPYLARLLRDVVPVSTSTRRSRREEMELDKFLLMVERQCGRGLRRALRAYDGDKAAVFDQIAGVNRAQAIPR